MNSKEKKKIGDCHSISKEFLTNVFSNILTNKQLSYLYY